VLELERRRLGRTGYEVSILTIGGCGPGICPDAETGVKAVQDAMSRGLNMLDIAPSYGEAELRLGKLVRENRDGLVITEKTMERSREGAWRELKCRSRGWEQGTSTYINFMLWVLSRS